MGQFLSIPKSSSRRCLDVCDNINGVNPPYEIYAWNDGAKTYFDEKVN